MMPEFYRKLSNGTIQNQEPDGAEIVDSMKRAVITGPDTVQWTETCYCSPPLKHERETVYDKYFSDLETVPVESYRKYSGKPFMEYLQDLKT